MATVAAMIAAFAAIAFPAAMAAASATPFRKGEGRGDRSRGTRDGDRSYGQGKTKRGGRA
jgi:hypothetical protein